MPTVAAPSRLLALSLALLAPAVPGLAGPLPYRLVAQDSVVGFTWVFGGEPQRGRMPVARAVLMLDFDDLRRCQVEVAVSVAGAEAGFPFASQALKGPKMLDATRFPEIAFRSTAIRPDGGGARVEGLLTIRGVTLPAVLHASLHRLSGADPAARDELVLRLTGTVSRSAFGASGWADAVGDRVDLDILAHIRRGGT